MNRELISVIDEIGRQKGIDKGKVIGAIEAALQTAAKKRFGQAENIQVEIDPKTGETHVSRYLHVVELVENDKIEISLADLVRAFAPTANAIEGLGFEATITEHKRAVLADPCRGTGRDPATTRVTGGDPPPLVRATRADAAAALGAILVAHGMAPDAAARTAASSPFVGTVEEVVAGLRRLRGAGVEEVMFDWPAPFDPATLEALAGPVRDRLAAG